MTSWFSSTPETAPTKSCDKVPVPDCFACSAWLLLLKTAANVSCHLLQHVLLGLFIVVAAGVAESVFVFV